ncbi:MAG: DUF3796 domain-containing protein [Defluviitaleaceae bacterium]|nr:DUF3796 domain-containing protein [Defluviitaleaceae bacterium]
MKKPFRNIHPAFGLFGLIGFTAFHGSPTNGICFAFFGLFFSGLFGRQKPDERLIENYKKGMDITARLGMLLALAILVMLRAGVASEFVLLWGSVAYGFTFTFGMALAYFFDKRG